MTATIDGYKEIREIYDKLSKLRESTQSCTQKMMGAFSADCWLENDLIDSLTHVTDEMKAVQISLFNELKKRGIEVQDTVAATEEAIEKWNKEEIEKCMAVQLKKILDNVCAISYDGDKEEIRNDLTRIQQEASELAKDVNHYVDHKDRIQDFGSLLNWVNSTEPLSFEDSRACQEKFGFNIYYAVMSHWFKLNAHPVVLEDKDVVTLENNTEKVETDAAEPEVEETIGDTLPESCFFEDELPIESVPVKPRLYKSSSATRFKKEFEQSFRGIGMPGYDILKILIEDIIIEPKLIKAIFKSEGVKDPQIQLLENKISAIYELGLSKKLTYFGCDAYILNRDIPQLNAIYKSETMKRLINYNSLEVFSKPINVPSVWYVRSLIKIKTFLKVFNGKNKYAFKGKSEDCSIDVIVKDACGKTEFEFAIIAPVFTYENKADDVKSIIDFLEKYSSSITALLVGVRGKDEITYWNKQFARFNLSKVVFYNYIDDIILDTDGKEIVSTDSLLVAPTVEKADSNNSKEVPECDKPVTEDAKENSSEVTVEETTEKSESDNLPESSYWEDSLTFEGNPVKEKMYKSVSKFKSEFDRALHNIDNRYFVLNNFIRELVIDPKDFKKRYLTDREFNVMFGLILSCLYDAGLIKKLNILGTEVYTLNRKIPALLSIYKNASMKNLIQCDSCAVLENAANIRAIRYVRDYIKARLITMIFSKRNFYRWEEYRGSCIALTMKTNSPTPNDVKTLIGIMFPLFEQGNEDADMNDIIATLGNQAQYASILIIAIRSREEIAYWNNKVARFNIDRIVYYNYVDDAFIDTDGVTNIEKEEVLKLVAAIPEKQEAQEESLLKKELHIKDAGVSLVDNKETEAIEPNVIETEANTVVSELDEGVEVNPETEVATKEEPAPVVEEDVEDNTAKEVESSEEVSTLPQTVSIAKEVVSKEQISEMFNSIADQFDKHHIAEGMLMLHGMNRRVQEDWSHQLLSQVSFVLGDPLYSHIPVRETPYKYWNYTVDVRDMDVGNSMDYFNAASMIRYFFKPAYDGGRWHWQANQAWKQISDDSSNVALQRIPLIKSIISCFRTFLEQNEKGIGWCLGGQNKIQEERRQELSTCENELKDMKQRLDNRKIKRLFYSRVIKTYEAICWNSDLYLYISSPKDFSVDDILAFCNSFSDTPISKEDIVQDETTVYTVSGAKLDQYMDEVWDSIIVAHKQTENFRGSPRSSLKALLVNAFSALGNYVIARCRVECNDGTTVDGKIVRKTIDEVRPYCTEVIGALRNHQSSNPLERIAIFSLKYLLKSLIKSFEKDKYKSMEFYEPFLLSNFVELDDRYLPCVDFNFLIPELSLYNRCLKHIAVIEQEKLSPGEEDIYSSLAEKALGSMDMGFYKLLLHRLNREVDIREEDIIERGGDYLERRQDDFRSELELAYNYGRLTQKNEIEAYETMAKTLVTHLQETQNFGLFDIFVNACKERIDIDSKPRQEDLEKQFINLKDLLYKRISKTGETLADYPILNEIEKCLKNRNFSVAEDYMRQCQDGNLTEIKSLLGGDPEEFMQFKDSYQTYYNICSKNNRLTLDHTLDQWFSSKGKSRSNATKNAIGKGQVNFVKEWDKLLAFGNRGNRPTPENFLEMLGYPVPIKVKTVTQQTNNRMAYDVEFKSEPTHQYAHPFKQFGSGIFERGLRVITFTGAHSPENIVNELSDAGVERQVGTICLLNACMPWADRCKLAELMKCSDTMYNVIVIDRIMALYLSQFEKLDRENKMMKLCMPFANATPFTSKGFIPPEMFIGRTRELAEIRNMDGPNLVYGGRQLGKSILLRQVSFLDNRPSKGYYAFYFDMKNKDANDVLEAISAQLVKAKLLNHEISDWDSLEDAMEEVLPKITQLILLIDEADAFIVSSNKENDHPIEALRVTQNKYQGRFKFVLAGLHNVIRYDKSSLSSNTVYGQLEHINIRPFEFADACDLLLTPLSYLGFTISDPAIVSTILAKTNYFPGLIQYYGMKILESVKTAYRKHNFRDTNTPPYQLDETYLKNLMEDDSFLREIEDKFMITLHVDKDDDNLYYLITLGVAYLYAADDKPVTLEKLKDVLSGTKVRDLDDNKLSALLDELKELNVLRSVNENEYIFNRYSFYSILGGADKIEKALSEYEDR